MANDSKPNLYQLLSLCFSIKNYIDSKSAAEADFPDISGIESDLDSIRSLLKGSITIAEMNSWSGKNLTNNGLYAVVDSNNTTFGLLVVGSISSACQSLLYIGPTASSPGKVSELKAPTTQGYGKQPGLSFAVRYNVLVGALFIGSGIKNGLTDWDVVTVADYKTGFCLGGGRKEWKGTKAEYDSLSSKDPDTIYYILK